jgi:hypothetical protein
LAGGNAILKPPHVRHLTAISVKGKPYVWIDYDDQGVYVSADIVREDGRGVATLRRNQFAINTNNYYELRRPNRHELVVIDKSSTVVLHAEFLNEQAFRIQGRFAQPGYGTLLIIHADRFSWLPSKTNANIIEGNCMTITRGFSPNPPKRYSSGMRRWHELRSNPDMATSEPSHALETPNPFSAETWTLPTTVT